LSDINKVYGELCSRLGDLHFQKTLTAKEALKLEQHEHNLDMQISKILDELHQLNNKAKEQRDGTITD